METFSDVWCPEQRQKKETRTLHGKSIRGRIEIPIVLSSTKQTNIKILYEKQWGLRVRKMIIYVSTGKKEKFVSAATVE